MDDGNEMIENDFNRYVEEMKRLGRRLTEAEKDLNAVRDELDQINNIRWCVTLPFSINFEINFEQFLLQQMSTGSSSFFPWAWLEVVMRGHISQAVHSYDRVSCRNEKHFDLNATPYQFQTHAKSFSTFGRYNRIKSFTWNAQLNPNSGIHRINDKKVGNENNRTGCVNWMIPNENGINSSRNNTEKWIKLHSQLFRQRFFATHSRIVSHWTTLYFIGGINSEVHVERIWTKWTEAGR